MELRFIAIANFQDSIHRRSFVGAHIVGKSPFGQELFDKKLANSVGEKIV